MLIFTGGRSLWPHASTRPFDVSVKPRRDPGIPICPVDSGFGSNNTFSMLVSRQITEDNDYTCYYEAWVHDRACNGMSIDQIPVGSLTHLMFSFGYITPGDFQIVPMDDLDENLFTKMASLKQRNQGLKVMIALGGWTFNDPGATQNVFHDVVSTKSNREMFIGNLLSFLRQYAFDGVDFDWEYPGADDRGGMEGDGENFTKLLEELRAAIGNQPLEYVVSFTTPTSYWYLRHFDLKASSEAVDFVNVMSYDLHGVWDAHNPIGSHVLAHTNLTEIKFALDLYWRNGVDPEKLNLGFGFYGRTFELSDPTCHKPGCPFSGGANPGPCTQNSGTLAYREINDIIKKNDLEPYHVEDDAVKYIVWNNNQWASYLDQDTDDLEALSAVVGSDRFKLSRKSTTSEDAALWQDIVSQSCYVTDCGGSCKTGPKRGCNAGDEPLTFQGQFRKDNPDLDALHKLKGSALLAALEQYETDDISLYCCPPDDLERWSNCEWKGKEGNCFDAHCDINTQVALTSSPAGGAVSCFPNIERTRVFCCDPPAGEPLFLPVPLENLFPNPPVGDEVTTDFDLQVDNTWGDGDADTSEGENPDSAAFQFFVLASPGEIQTSLDKRDGSHWELFNCNDAVSEEAQTVQMICSRDFDNSNCGNIYKGKGAPGTIIQMPQGQGCGPGKYAVVKTLEVARNQSLPRHLQKREFSHKPVVYDLTFDYDFLRVPRDLGDTQMRIDFSNQEGYWSNIVAASPSRKSKRTLADVGGSHRRWLEEEWRDEMHFGLVDRDDLHKRWFGEDAVAWLKGLLNVNIKVDKRHDYEEEISAIILQEEWQCGNFQAKIDAIATAAIKMSTSFGFTLITTLPELDLKNSFLHFNNEGSVEAVFTLDALMKMDWDSEEFTMVPLPIPGGTFNIPGIVKIGPSLDLNARFKAGISVAGRIEARAAIADWEIRQTFPKQSDEYKPKELDGPNRTFDDDDLSGPSFDASVVADGYAEVHLIPTLVFGIQWHKQWNIDNTDVKLQADTYGRIRAHSDIVGGNCAFGYAVDAGVELIATADVPAVFQWKPEPFRFGGLEGRVIPRDPDAEYLCLTEPNTKRETDSPDRNSSALARPSRLASGIRKRLVPYGPVLSLPKIEHLCPSKGDMEEPGECINIYAVDDFYDATDSDAFFERRSEDFDHSPLLKRAIGKTVTVCPKDNVMNFIIPNWDTKRTYAIYDNGNWADCNDYTFGLQPGTQAVPKPSGNTGNERYVVEHILEANMLAEFMNAYNDLCGPMKKAGWGQVRPVTNGNDLSPWDYVGATFPHKATTSYPAFMEDEFVRVIESINIIKQKVFRKKDSIPGEKGMAKAVASEATVDRAIRTMKNVLMTYEYVAHADIGKILAAQVTRVGERFEDMEEELANDISVGWRKRDIRGKWLKFAKGRTERAVGQMRAFLDKYMERIDKVLANTDSSEDSSFPGRAARRTKIAELKAAIKGKTKWENPL
ncbi:hypothetical protein DV738_g1033, partial [Chaetothyriales sp. CBS 135597]